MVSMGWSDDPNMRYTNRVVNHLTGSSCSVKHLTIAKFSDDVFCLEGIDFEPGEICTLACRGDRAPVFAQLVCKKGELHPPGFLKKLLVRLRHGQWVQSFLRGKGHNSGAGNQTGHVHLESPKKRFKMFKNVKNKCSILRLLKTVRESS